MRCAARREANAGLAVRRKVVLACLEQPSFVSVLCACAHVCLIISILFLAKANQAVTLALMLGARIYQVKANATLAFSLQLP